MEQVVHEDEFGGVFNRLDELGLGVARAHLATLAREYNVFADREVTEEEFVTLARDLCKVQEVQRAWEGITGKS